jgi:hypothetical protein
MLALKECLLAELKPADRTSDITASGEGYDESLHSLMQTFWDMFCSGPITQNVTCTICSCVTTREEPFSELLVQFPRSHHKATPTNQKCTLNSLIKHHFKQAMIHFFANSTTRVTRIMFDCTQRFPSGSSPTTPYSNPGAQGE